MRTVTPTGIERSFDREEILVSKTDPHGVITYANHGFLDVSRYTEQQLLGAPHSIVRHPDMPHGVFRLMWDELQAGREVFAYVLNLAADGAHYWVFAHVTPSRLGGRTVGYHSSRRHAEPSAVRAVEELYGGLRHRERPHRSVRDRATAGRAALQEHLDGRSLTYGQLVWSLAERQVA